MNALIIDRVSPLVASGLKEHGVEVDIEILPGVERLKELLPKYDLLVMRVDPKLDRELLDAAAKRVKMIAVCSAGINHIDVAYAKELGIRVCNASYAPNGVADFTVVMILMCLRHYKQALWRGTRRCRGHISGTSINTPATSSRATSLESSAWARLAAASPTWRRLST